MKEYPIELDLLPSLKTCDGLLSEHYYGFMSLPPYVEKTIALIRLPGCIVYIGDLGPICIFTEYKSIHDEQFDEKNALKWLECYMPPLLRRPGEPCKIPTNTERCGCHDDDENGYTITLPNHPMSICHGQIKVSWVGENEMSLIFFPHERFI